MKQSVKNNLNKNLKLSSQVSCLAFYEELNITN